MTHDLIVEEIKENVVYRLRYSDIAPPRITLVLPQVVMFEDVIDIISFLVSDVVVMMEDVSVVGVMDMKFEDVIRIRLGDVSIGVMREWEECIAFHSTPSNSTTPP